MLLSMFSVQEMSVQDVFYLEKILNYCTINSYNFEFTDSENNTLFLDFEIHRAMYYDQDLRLKIFKKQDNTCVQTFYTNSDIKNYFKQDFNVTKKKSLFKSRNKYM